MLQNNHAHMREGDENECHQNYGPGHSCLSISCEINDPKGHVVAWIKRNCLIWLLTFWRLCLITCIISIISVTCQLETASRLRGLGERRLGGCERPLLGSTSAGSAGCGKAASNQHGVMGSDKAGPVVFHSSADFEPLALDPPPSHAEMCATCNCNCSCPPSSPAALSVPPPSCVVPLGSLRCDFLPKFLWQAFMNAPIIIRQLRICALVAARMAACSSNV